jgi:hypothetical protein
MDLSMEAFKRKDARNELEDLGVLGNKILVRTHIFKIVLQRTCFSDVNDSNLENTRNVEVIVS